ncbi:MAG: aminotransferase class I/II-fold pyridoxal phosphate-dependent enzyme [Planctomycetota bacterium]|jgi:2-aminoadipate transaminase
MGLEDIRLSGYGAASRAPSPVGRMMADFAADFRDGVDINLGVGYVNERTIPSEAIADALAEVLAHPERHRLPFNYGGPRGSPNLVASIRRYLDGSRASGLTREVLGRCEVIIGPTGATSILEGAAQVLPTGIVLTSDPMYYIYCEFLERSGFEVVAVPEDDEGIRVDLLEEEVARLGGRKADVSFVYVVTVANPTCTIMSNARRRELVEAAARLSRDLGRRVPVLLDRAYEDLVHDPGVPPIESAIPHDDSGLVHEIGTLSKVLAPALRVGYMVGPPSGFMDAMVQRSSDVGFSAPLAMQEVASVMLDRHVEEQLDKVNAGYREKAVAVRGWIDEFLGPHVERVTGGSAGFYFYLTLRDTDTREGSDFQRFLSRTTGDERVDGPEGAKRPRVAYIPGECCVHPRGRLVEQGGRQLRLSYGYEELPRIREALVMMREAADHARERAGGRS